jgi:hypothetical protein
MNKKLSTLAFSLFALPLVALAPLASAAAPVVVTPSNNQGWVFNGDPTTSTPYEFNENEASIGEGSLYVKPIGANPADKFIAAKTLNIPAIDLESVSYDFLIAGDGTAADEEQFYLNVYTKLAGSTAYYNCRFDYVPATGSTSDFTTATFMATDTPVNVGDRPADAFTCPATLAEMPADSTVSFVALNVGDTSMNDQGLAGYLDNVVITTAAGSTIYDFETNPTVLANKEACKSGGWMTSEAPAFKNQGDCVSSFASQGKAKGNPVANFFSNLF